MVKRMLMVMGGGALGAMSRYGVGLLTADAWGVHFPWATLVVNLAGCFLIGLLFSLSDRIRPLSPNLRLFVITGYLGALTTFSSFSLETVHLAGAGTALLPLSNILANHVGGLTLTFIGLRLGRPG